MNDPPPPSSDQQQLPDAPQAQRVPVQQVSAAATQPAPPSTGVTPSQACPGQSLLVGFPSQGNAKALPNVNSQLGKAGPVVLPPFPTNLGLLGAAAAAQQQQQIQNAGILRSLMDQKQQITKYEDEIRRRMLLPPSDPLLQAHLVQNDPGRFLSAMGLLGNMGVGFPPPPPLPASLAQLPAPVKNHALIGDGRSLRGGVIEPFPEKLHRLLLETEAAGKSDIISFVANGRAFMIHKPDRFFKEIVPQYFNHKRLSSFKRQLNLYSFELIATGNQEIRGAYYHKLFVKDHPELCLKMRRSVTSKAYSKNREARKDVNLEVSTSSDVKHAPPALEPKAETAGETKVAKSS